MPTSPLISMLGPDLDAMGGISTVAQTWLNAASMKGIDVQYFGTLGETRNSVEKAALVLRRQARFVSRLATGWHASYFTSFYRKMAYFKQAQATGAPVIIHLHAPDLPAFYEASKIHRSAIHHVFRQAARVVVLSEDMARIIRGWLGDEVRLHVLYNPVQLSGFDCSTRPDRAHPTMLFMGPSVNERVPGIWSRPPQRLPRRCPMLDSASVEW